MATISTTFKAVDEISPVLQKVISSVGSVTEAAKKADAAINGIKSKGLSQVTDSAKSADKALDDIDSKGLNDVDNEATKTSKGLSVIKADATGAGSALGSIKATGLTEVGSEAKGVSSSFSTLKSDAISLDDAIDEIDPKGLEGIQKSTEGALDELKRLSQQAKDLSQDVGGVDDSAFKELTSSAKSADSAIDLIDVGSLGGVASAADAADKALGGITLSAREADSGIDGIDTQELEQVITVSTKASTVLGAIQASAKQADSAIDGIDGAGISQVSAHAQTADNALGTLSISAREADSALDTIDGEGLKNIDSLANGASNALDDLGKKAETATQKISRIDEVSNKLKSAGSIMQHVGSVMSGIGKVGSVVTGALTGLAGSAAKTSIEFAKTYESASTVFKQMYGGEEAAKSLYSSLLKVAQGSTFSQETFLNAGKALAGVGVSADNTVKYLQAITDAVTGFGGDAQNIEQITNAFQKVATNGKISMEEINMMADGGIQALKILGNQYGKTTSEMSEMVSSGALPAEEALGKLTEGIEQGTKGINGETAALSGMAASLKGKTLTGAIDSMSSCFRNLKVAITGIDLTHTVLTSDAEIEESQNRYNQLTATIVKFQSVITSCAKFFKPLNEAFGKLLDLLIGTEPVFNDVTGQWENTDGILTKLQAHIDNMSPEKVEAIGKAILGIGVAAPVLTGTGKAIDSIGAAIDSLSEKKKTLEKVLNLFSNNQNTKAQKEEPEEAQTKTKKTKTSVNLPNVAGPFQTFIDKIKGFGKEISAATDETVTGATDSMKKSFGAGISGLMDDIKASFDAGKSKIKVSDFFSSVKDDFGSGVEGLSASAATMKKTGSLADDALAVGFDAALSKNTVPKAFGKLNTSVASQSMTFGQKMKAALSKAIPQGDTIFGRITNSFATFGTTLGTSLSSIGTAVSGGLTFIGSKFLKIIPDSAVSFVKSKLGIVTGLFSGFISKIGTIFSPLGTLVTKALSGVSGVLGGFSGAISGVFGSLSSIFAPFTSMIGSVISGITGLVSAFLPVAGVVGVAVVAIGGLVAALGKLNEGGVAAQNLANSFASFNQKVADFGNWASTAIQNFVTNLQTQFPVLIQQGAQMVVTFVTGVLTTIPTLIATAFQVVGNFLTGIMQAIPTLIQGGFQAIQAIITGIMQNMPAVGNSILSAINTIWTTITTNLPKIVEAGGQILMSIINGIVTLLPQLWQWAVQAVMGFKDWIVTNLPVMVQAGGEMLRNLISGLISHIPDMIGAVTSLVGGFLSFLWEHKWEILQAGGQLVLDLITGIGQLTGTLIQSVFDLGKNIIQGIWDGITSLWGDFTSWISDNFNGVIDNIKGWFGIASPSTVMADIGTNLIAGLQQGAENLWNNVSTTFQTIGNAVLDFLTPDQPPDYTALIAQTQAQLEQLRTSVQQNYEQLAAVTSTSNQVIAQNTVGAFAAMAQSAVAQIGGMVGQINAIFAQVPASMGAIFANIPVIATGALEALKAQTIAEIQSLIVGMQGPLSQITTIFTGIFSLVGQQIIAMLTAISAQAGAVISGMAISMGAQFTAIATGFTVTFNGMLLTCSFILGQLLLQTTVTLTQISVQATAIITGMTISLSNLFTDLSTEITTTTNTMKESVISSLNEMNAAIAAAVEVLRTQYTSSWQDLVSACKEAVDDLKNSVIAALTEMGTACTVSVFLMKTEITTIVSAMAIQVQNTVETFVGKVINAIDKLPPEFRKVGQDMMTELKAGIDANTQSVIDATNNLVQKLKKTFTDGLGIHSPSRFMTWVGEMMASGLLNGLSASQIKSFTESIIEDMRQSFIKGNFNAEELVDFLQDDTLDVIRYLQLIDDKTVSEAVQDTGVPAIIQAAEKEVGYITNSHTFSKYGQHYGTNGAWCVFFVRNMAEEAGVPFPATGYVPDVMSWAMANGRWTNTPVPGYAAIFGGGSHIELVADVDPAGNVTCIGGNTGPGPIGVHKRVRNGATGYVALDGGHPIAMTLKDTITQAYFKKRGAQAFTSGVDLSGISLNGVDLTGINFSGTDIAGLGDSIGLSWWSPPPEVSRWTPVVVQALTLMGEPLSLTKGVLYAIERESGGNPNDINTWDSNARAGIPSQGLLQVIPPGYGPRSKGGWGIEGLEYNNIMDPLTNILCGLGEMKLRHGGIDKCIGVRAARHTWWGYAVGTRNVPEDMMAMIHQGEAILPKTQNPYSESGGDYLGEIGAVIASSVFDIFGRAVASFSSLSTEAFNVEPNVYESTESEKSFETTAGGPTWVTNTDNRTQPVNVNVNLNFGDIHNGADLDGYIDSAKEKILEIVSQAITRGNAAKGVVKTNY